MKAKFTLFLDRVKVKNGEGEKNELSRQFSEAKQKIQVLSEMREGLQRENGELRTSLRDVEKSRLDARRELQELRRQVR